MKKSQKGSMTIFLALSMLFFLSFCMVLMEGVRSDYFRVKAQQAMELAEFSVLSEYQYELFHQYGVFFVDLDYELGDEHTAVLEKSVEKYLLENASELETKEVNAKNFRRATDAGGISFFKQAVELMKVQSGYTIFEEVPDDLMKEESLDMGELLEQNETQAEGILNERVDEAGMPLFDISLPDISFPSIEALTEAVFGERSELSEKMINPEERLLKRVLEKGIGKKASTSVIEMQLFHRYLFEHFNFYERQEEALWKETLEYQLEYIISGETEDFKNLENIMWRIFLLRASGDYLFYHQDSEKMAAAEAEAIAIAGISGNAGLIKAVREIILIAQSIEAAVQETRHVFAGEKVPLYTQGVFSGLEIGYEEYLYLLLNTTSRTEKIYRCMDIVEMEVRQKSGYGHFRLDHCTDCFDLTWEYQFDSLFTKIPLISKGSYEETMKRKFYYER